VDGQNSDRCRGARGEKGRRALLTLHGTGVSGGEDVVVESFIRLKRHFLRMRIRSALPSIIRQLVALQAGGWRWVGGLVEIENEDATVFAGDLDWLPGFGALVEQVEPRVSIVSGNPFADGLPGWLDGLERLDVEGRFGRVRLLAFSSGRMSGKSTRAEAQRRGEYCLNPNSDVGGDEMAQDAEPR